MKVLVVGAGGVGSAFARIAAQRDSFEKVVIADYDGGRAERAAQSAADHFSGVQVDASDESAITELLRSSGCDAALNAVDPRFVMPVFGAALAAGTTYVDMAMSLSHPDPEHPYSKTGVKLGDEQFAHSTEWEERGLLALVGMGVEPGFVRHLRPVCGGRAVLLGRRGRRPGRGEPRRRRLRLLSDLLHLGDHRRMSEPSRHMGEGAWVVHDRAVQRARDVPLSRRHRPGRMCECGTRRSPFDPTVDRYRPGHLQVRPRRRIHSGPQDAPHARAGCDERSVRGQFPCCPAGRRGGMPSRSGGDRRADARPDRRRHLGEGYRQGRRTP